MSSDTGDVVLAVVVSTLIMQVFLLMLLIFMFNAIRKLKIADKPVGDDKDHRQNSYASLMKRMSDLQDMKYSGSKFNHDVRPATGSWSTQTTITSENQKYPKIKKVKE